MNQSRSFTLLLWYITAVFLSRYSECADFLLQLTKLNTTSLYSGFFGFTASTQSPHAAAVPVRSARSRPPETCIVGPDLRLGPENPSVPSSNFKRTSPRTGSEPLCGALKVESTMLPVGGLPGCWTNWISIWICEVWPASCEWSHRSSHSLFFELHVRLRYDKQVSQHKQIHSTKRFTLVVSSCYHPLILETNCLALICKQFSCIFIGWDMIYCPFCLDSAVVCHIFSHLLLIFSHRGFFQG